MKELMIHKNFFICTFFTTIHHQFLCKVVTFISVDHIEQIVTAFFQYVSMIQKEGLQAWIYKEIAVCL